MCRYVFIFLLATSSVVSAQVRVAKLVVKPHEVFDLGQSDILVADTLIMMDSSTLILNKLKTENFIRVKVAKFGRQCLIDGRGTDGQPGRNGINGVTPIGPCINGSSGKDGTKGLDGTRGLNLFIYFEKISISGHLAIDVSGGTGGKGGSGGNGGGGSPGTLHCLGGNGGNGGSAGPGGNGGKGGVLTMTVPVPQLLRDLIAEKKLTINYAGGSMGPSGKGGYHGGAGLGPSKRNGKDGVPGPYSRNGVAGDKGDLIIEAN